MKGYDKSELFTITGTDVYKSNLTLCLPLKLVKEQYNKPYMDAIAVYARGEKIGYVANNDDTGYELTSSASELQDKIDDITQGSYLFSLEGIAGNRTFHIGRIIC